MNFWFRFLAKSRQWKKMLGILAREEEERSEPVFLFLGIFVLQLKWQFNYW
jgi:hypothetical protein